MRLICFGCSNTYGSGLVNPETESWPYILGSILDIETINRGVPGASNLEILNNILKFEFKENDRVIVMWGPIPRDYLMDTGQQIGSWMSSELIDHWVLTHSHKDLAIRSWLYIHHANCYFQSIGIKPINIAVTYEDLIKFKPSYIDKSIVDDIKMDLIKFLGDKAQDKMHPGVKSHKKIAAKIHKLIK